jgi:hypothetical protein
LSLATPTTNGAFAMTVGQTDRVFVHVTADVPIPDSSLLVTSEFPQIDPDAHFAQQRSQQQAARVPEV